MQNSIWKNIKLGFWYSLIWLGVTIVAGLLGVKVAATLDFTKFTIGTLGITVIFAIIFMFWLKGFIMTYLQEKVR